MLPQSHLRSHCTDYATFLKDFFFIFRLWLWQLNDNHRFFYYFFTTTRCLALSGPPQQELLYGSESIPGRLLLDLVHQGVGQLGRHLVTAIWYQCSHIWLVRYFGGLIFFGVFFTFEVSYFKFSLFESFVTIWVFSTICVTICVCHNSSFVINWVFVTICVETPNKNT